eukprot:3003229-Rhodomonas_salina.2
MFPAMIPRLTALVWLRYTRLWQYVPPALTVARSRFPRGQAIKKKHRMQPEVNDWHAYLPSFMLFSSSSFLRVCVCVCSDPFVLRPVLLVWGCTSREDAARAAAAQASASSSSTDSNERGDEDFYEYDAGVDPRKRGKVVVVGGVGDDGRGCGCGGGDDDDDDDDDDDGDDDGDDGDCDAWWWC